MSAALRVFATVVALVCAATAAAAAQLLQPEWSRPVGGKTRLVGVEEYGRCSVFVDNGAIQVVAPTGEVAWTWRYSKVSKYINPRDVAVSPACDAVALVGDASYKFGWIVQQDGTATRLTFTTTPAEASFESDGQQVGVTTFSGSQHLYTRAGQLLWSRESAAKWSPASFGDEANGRPDDLPIGYRWRIAVSQDGARMWLRGEESIDCVSSDGSVLATIAATPSIRGVTVSREFGQVLLVTEKNLHPVSVERYVIPAPCKP